MEAGVAANFQDAVSRRFAMPRGMNQLR
jgi:hypothetical protein